jgi:hypothetical protein
MEGLSEKEDGWTPTNFITIEATESRKIAYNFSSRFASRRLLFFL